MQIVYISNYFNHHQKPLSDAFDKITKGSYRFIETTEIPEERKLLGYQKLDADYVIGYMENERYVDDLILAAEVVIIGEAPVKIVQRRLQKGLLTFHDNERRYKSIIKYLKWPIYTLKSIVLNKGFLLCASAFASRDFRLSGMSVKKCFKWGYFTEVKKFDVERLISEKFSFQSSNHKILILWAARFIRLKHPELVVLLAERLKNLGYDFTIKMIGTGVMEDEIRTLIDKKELNDCITLLGAMKPDDVRSHMERADIFLATSDQNEGWGATVNESMSSACAIVASHSIGAVPFLITHKQNGLIFKSEDLLSLTENVQWLIENEKDRLEISQRAYETMITQWNPGKASENFLLLTEALRKGTQSPIADGPCSLAPVYRNNWFLK